MLGIHSESRTVVSMLLPEPHKPAAPRKPLTKQLVIIMIILLIVTITNTSTITIIITNF